MELLCPCGATKTAALPDVWQCNRCGLVWIYERTEFANDWRCVKEPTAHNTAGPWPCPVCGHRLDCQGHRRDRQGFLAGIITTYDLWCHNCATHIIMRSKS